MDIFIRSNLLKSEVNHLKKLKNEFNLVSLNQIQKLDRKHRGYQKSHFHNQHQLTTQLYYLRLNKLN